MIRHTWRQMRGECVGMGVLLGVLGIALLATGLQMRGFEGGLACLSTTAPSSCGGQGDFVRAFGTLVNLSGWLNFIPLLIGIFIGAPLVAREIEQGTHRLVWTQSVTRRRWLLIKLAGVVAVAAVVGAILAVLMMWWRQPWDLIRSSFDGAGFDFEGVMPIAYSLFALSLGLLAGTLIRRTLPAMAITVAGFLAVRLPIEDLLRPHFMTPITRLNTDNAAPQGAWILDQGFIDSHGNQVFDSQAFQTCGPSMVQSLKQAGACLAQHGIHASVVYQPADRFWPFQLMEGGIYLVLSVALLTSTVVWIQHRMS